MKKTVARNRGFHFRSIIVGPLLYLVFLCAPLIAISQEEGGVSGADFLTSTPIPRYNSMGGVFDGLDYYLEAVHVNPAGYAPIDRMSFQFAIMPYPNEVRHSQLSFGIPLLGGVGIATGQFLNTGGFTYINENLQPEDTVSVYDASASIGYSRYVWDELSVGINLKMIYRTLGDYNAFAFGGDVGAAYWFETPHVGQRPKPPTTKKLEKKYNAKLGVIENENDRKVKEVSAVIGDLEEDIETLEKNIDEISGKIDSSEGEKRQNLIAKRAEMETELAGLNTRLSEEQEKSREDLEEIETWYSVELRAAEEVYSNKLADLNSVESERTKLFAIVNEPERELTEEMIDAAIDEVIDKTQSYQINRIGSLDEQNAAFAEIRQKRIDEIAEEISVYMQQIKEETGPEIARLQKKLEELEEQKSDLEASEAEDAKEKLQTVDKRISETQRELEAAMDDPWIKRLNKRIEEKKGDIEKLNDILAENNEKTNKAIDELKKSTESDIESFNITREGLKRELKKAKLKQELDLLNANKDKQRQKAIENYEKKENEIYTDLLSVRYTNEEKLIKASVDAIEQDYENNRYDYQTQYQKEYERLEDEFAFQERYLTKKIAELEKKNKSQEDGNGDKNELASLNKELEDKRNTYNIELDELEKSHKQRLAEQNSVYEKKLEELEWEKEITRLIYLQTDEPYRNTFVHASLANFGTNVTFVQEGYPLPTIAHIGAGYALLNTYQHTVRLGLQFDIPFHDELALGVGAEYGFLHMFFGRVGYTFLTPYKSFSFGLGARVPVGFTDFSVDYTFQPIPDYGFVHTFGIAAYF
jgi:hypothetical protein